MRYTILSRFCLISVFCLSFGLLAQDTKKESENGSLKVDSSGQDELNEYQSMSLKGWLPMPGNPFKKIVPTSIWFPQTSDKPQPPAVIQTDSDIVALNGANATSYPIHTIDPNWYFGIEFLLWEVTDPSERGVIFNTTSSDPTSPLNLNGYSTGKSNTDPQTGLRTTFGKRFNDLWLGELVLRYMNPYSDPPVFRSEDANSGGFGGGVIQNRAFFTPQNLLVTEAVLLYKIVNSTFETNSRINLWNTPSIRLEGILGLRMDWYREEFDSRMTPIGSNQVHENFRAENFMFGPQIGLDGTWQIFEYVSLRTRAKMSFSANWITMNITGPEDPSVTSRLTQPSIEGAHLDSTYTGAYELGIGLVFHLAPNFKVYTGYDAVYYSDLARVMDQLDLAGAAVNNPQYALDKSFAWYSGLTAELRLEW